MGGGMGDGGGALTLVVWRGETENSGVTAERQQARKGLGNLDLPGPEASGFRMRQYETPASC